MRDVAVGAVGGEAVVERGFIRGLPRPVFVGLLKARPALHVMTLCRNEGTSA